MASSSSDESSTLESLDAAASILMGPRIDEFSGPIATRCSATPVPGICTTRTSECALGKGHCQRTLLEGRVRMCTQMTAPLCRQFREVSESGMPTFGKTHTM